MNPERLDALSATYRDGLLLDTLPFWLRHAVDREHGGFLFCLDRDGTVVDTDKGVWQHGRFTWLLATLCNTVERRAEWFELARHGVDFLRRHCFDRDGRMLFQVTREGAPLRRRRYVFSEAFGAIAFAAWARASGDEQAAEQARALFRLMIRYGTTPGLIPPKVDPATRPSKSIAFPMIALITAKILRDDLGDPFAAEWVDRAIDEIRTDFVKPDLEVVMETVGPHGELIDHFDGRTLNPGHALEAAWFVLDEAWHRGGDRELTRLGVAMVDWMWRRGWDEEYGGIYYFRDLDGKPVQEYWHDMKFWWPHNEAVLATLLAHRATGEARFATWHGMVHDWAHGHFADPEHGEWFGYLHRDGRLSVGLKGNLWKGPFHLPRMQLVGWQVLAGMRADA
ncbi:MAG: AGE family epimerase/isomerase [Planctomycetes bacterium]|nr:AGE family epimerase/isomerase [Planctomycetota bacterium]